ncbi:MULTISPECIES: hypothetical protein [unclassified Rathayibacter]|uniref:hypothetical protein n=1 Tax=unclassified Rathayibacter TaxID=2609250 RepID=UPI0006F9068D|nr:MULTISPECIES: hypothetical protein [unclassified Rathayibacter]KQQ00069.1 hypothetical protein ASF42_16960 [Rathayibacter sp. Leaf294]KQS09523.1 hypothetical protein ASG06_16960 [Rathayibacter sp. Leaf185]
MTAHSSSTPLRDSAARDWLLARGVLAGHAPALTLVPQEWTTPGVVLRRLWLTAAELRRAGSDAGATLLVVPLEGVVTFTTQGGATAELGRGRLAALPASATLTTAAPSARLELLSRRPGPAPEPAVLASPALPVLIATANAILDGPRDPDEPSRAGLGSALESLLTAVLAGSPRDGL